MALTQQDKEEMYQYLITRGKSLGSLDEGDSNLSNKYLAPVLEYSGGTASKAVRLAVSLLQGKSAVLRKSGDLVQWQLQGASTWETLYSIKDYGGAPGKDGKNPAFRKNGTNLEYKLEGEEDTTYKLLCALADITGPEGDHVVLRVHDGKLEYKQSKADDSTYQQLFILEDFRGPQGRPGKDFQILGYYDTIADLRTAITSPEPGEAYGVGTAAPYPIYIWDAVSQDWVNNGAIQGPAGRSGKSARVNTTTGYWEEFDDDAQAWKQTEALGVYNIATSEQDGLMSKDDKAKLDQMKGGDVEVSKENIEKVLTGNITTHSHNRIKGMLPVLTDTDIWDGTTISTYLSGSGTTVDPYLIQSCADWLHLIQTAKVYSGGEVSEEKSIIKYIKLVKNLDFDSKVFSMPDIDIVTQTNMCVLNDIDGNGCLFKNVYFKNTYSILCGAMYSNIHDIGIDSGRFVVDVSQKTEADFYSIFAGSTQYVTYNEKWNCYCKADFETEGVLSTDLQIVLLGVGFTGLTSHAIPENTGYYGRNRFINRCDVTSHGIILVYVPCMSMGENNTMHVYDTSATVVPPENLDIISSGYYPLYNGMASGIAFYNSDTIPGIVSIEETPLIDVAKTTAEMKSSDFLNLLNRETSIFVPDTYNVNDGYPIFPFRLSEQVLYDGYVTVSTFENALANLPGGSSSGAYVFDVSAILASGSSSGSITESQYTTLLNAIQSRTGVLLYANAGGMLASYPAYAYVINNSILLAALQITLGDSPGLFSGFILSIDADYAWSKSVFNLK